MSVYDDIATFGLTGDDAAHALPVPDEESTASAVETAFAVYADAFADTAAELHDQEPLFWSMVNVFHLRAERVARERREIETDIQTLVRQQDGSEIADVELQEAQTLHEAASAREDALILMREQAASQYEAHTGRVWTQRNGTRSGPAVTAAVIDARDYLRGVKEREAMRLAPEGTRVAIAGATDWTDTGAVWSALDRTRYRFGDVVLMHGGYKSGVDHIAALWARERGVPCIAYRPDFTRHKRAAPFKRNDDMIAAKPRAVIVFPGNGIVANLGEKAEAAGIPVWRPKLPAEAGA